MKRTSTSRIVFVLLGTLFGFGLSRAGATDYEIMQQMFLLESIHMYGFIGTAVVILLPLLAIARKRDRALDGSPMVDKNKLLQPGTVPGAILFGIGWSIAGFCPGPMVISLGEGKVYAIAGLAGAICGTWLLGQIQPYLSERFGVRL